MKQSLTIISILSIALLINCKTSDGGGKPPKIKSSDTTHVLATYLGYKLQGILYGPITKIVQDSVFTWKMANADSTEAERVWTTSTHYIVEVPIAVKDSITAQTLQIQNWNKKDTVVFRNLVAEEKYVREGSVNWDTAVKYLKQFIDTSGLKSPVKNN